MGKYKIIRNFPARGVKDKGKAGKKSYVALPNQRIVGIPLNSWRSMSFTERG